MTSAIDWEYEVNTLPQTVTERDRVLDATFRNLLAQSSDHIRANLTAWAERGDLTLAESLRLWERWGRVVEGIE